jgi:tetratricopeptide (TPR) repeat protein
MQEATALTTQELMGQSMEAFDAGNFEQALKAANEVIAAAPEAEQLAAAWFMKGVSNESLGNLPEAISAYTEATKLDPTRAAAWYRLSKVLLARSRPGLSSLARSSEAIASLNWPSMLRALPWESQAAALPLAGGCSAMLSNLSVASLVFPARSSALAQLENSTTTMAWLFVA